MHLASRQRLTASQLGRLCLDHLAEDPGRLAAFMDATGYDSPALRAALGTSALARGLIDHFAANESLMLALCAANALRPEDFMRVWHGQNRTD